MSTFLDNWLLRRAMSAPRGGGGGILPAEYQQVEYLQGNGSAYINTGYYPNTNTEIELRCKYTNTNSDNPMFAVDAGAYSYQGCTCSTASSSNVVMVFENTFTTQFEYQVDKVVDVSINKSAFSFDGATIPITKTISYASQHPLFILGWDRNGNKILSGTGCVYHLVIAESGTTLKDLYPCYRKSDNKPGMFDLVTRQFFTNANPSGNDFTVGPNI